MQMGLWCLLLCLLCSACATRAGRCEGAWQPINMPPQSKAMGTPPSADPERPIP
jgi:hypothetical protein